MNIDTLLEQFNRAIGWNAYLYFSSKILQTILTFVLFSTLSTQDFSLWTNINCSVYLILLWLDCGLRKSVPRYCADFSQNRHAMRWFLISIISFKLFSALLSLPMLYYIARFVINIPITNHTLYFCMAALSIVESTKNILLLIFQAHFWNKSFTLIESTTQMFGTTLIIALIYTNPNHHALIAWAFAIKIIGELAITGITITMLYARYEQYTEQQDVSINTQTLTKGFIKHSALMWASNTLKSLTERNFLVPLLTMTLGSAQANMFKIANDGALLFYRTAVKTIGTNDTALFAYVRDMPESERLTPIAFKKITTKIAALCLPLLAILIVSSYYSTVMIHDHIVFQLFFIITIGYLLETIVSGYERVLEVYRRYRLLLYAYIPYMLVLCALFSQNRITSIGLVTTLGCIHGVRLVSSLIMVYLARRDYALRFPLRFTLHIVLWLLPIMYILIILINLLNPLVLPHYR